MGKLVINVIAYIFLRYLIFLAFIYATNKDAKMVQWSDLRAGEDWFYFFWLFLILPIIESILFAIPFTYGLNKIVQNKSLCIFFLMAILFVFEGFIFYLIANQKIDIGMLTKIGISVVLFLVLFWKRLF